MEGNDSGFEDYRRRREEEVNDMKRRDSIVLAGLGSGLNDRDSV